MAISATQNTNQELENRKNDWGVLGKKMNHTNDHN